jgi:methylated-DNA-[protein]-cysteine S-methyltransferase
MDCYRTITSPLGDILLASDGSALTGLWFADSVTCPKNAGSGMQETELPVFEQTEEWLRIYFSGQDPRFRPDLAPHGSPFRMRVWSLLEELPYGTTSTYGELARTLADRMHISRMSAQAVGNAVKHNPISLIIPCHRIIGSDGSLTGYAGGIERKRALLALEHALKSE